MPRLRIGFRNSSKGIVLLLFFSAMSRAYGARKSITPAPPPKTTPEPPTESPIPAICIDGIRIDSSEIDEKTVEKYVESRGGDIILSIISKDPITALFTINRINEAHLVSGDFEIGVRTIEIRNVDYAARALLQEVEYLQHCVEKSVGIFIDADLYIVVKNLADDLDYNVWPFSSSRKLIFPKVSHLLFQMPWGGNRSASVEILSESIEIYNDFMDAARNEHLCLMHYRSSENVYVLLGNRLASSFKENGTIFAVPTGRTDKSFISDLPGNSYVLMESEVEVKLIDENSTQQLDESLMSKNILSSELLTIAGPLIDFAKWLNDSLSRNCKITDGIYHLETCNDFLVFVDDWVAARRTYRPSEILEILNIKKLGHLMTFEVFQKIVSKRNDSVENVELREIASQSFITNITTYFHYNPANETSPEIKTKFGQIFNCQYADGTNRKFPFYFNGESVMYWRLKPDAWVAAGLTACSLGIILSLAILIFIVVRISIGDVFEGNPLSSIALLISLVLLFSTFIPFGIEYVSDHRNSYITFEDAQTMNTLCSVRIFLITLCYCMTFSILLCRALMLASIGSEGGFLSHVNGYIQSVICLFSTLVQIGLSTQLLVVMHIAHEAISCDNLLYGHWFWMLISYDILLLFFIMLMTPFIVRSQRNYREGILLVIGAILMFIIWCVWIPMSFFGRDWRDAAIPLGVQATGWAILTGIMIPRTFLIVRGIERSDIAQALPSLTSLSFAQNNQYASEQSVYECVNPAMRNYGSREEGIYDVGHPQSPSEIPTLPLRGNNAGGVRRQLFGNLRNNNNHSIHVRRQSVSSLQSSLPPSPNKNTRF